MTYDDTTKEQLKNIIVRAVASATLVDKIETALAPNTRSDILEVLATDEIVSVRMAVASNPNTPASVLYMLQSDRNIHVRNLTDAHLMSRYCVDYFMQHGDNPEDDQDDEQVRNWHHEPLEIEW